MQYYSEGADDEIGLNFGEAVGLANLVSVDFLDGFECSTLSRGNRSVFMSSFSFMILCTICIIAFCLFCHS